MKSNLEKISNLERKLEFSIPSNTVDSKFMQAYQNIQKQADLPGFRKGKAPIGVIKQKFQDRVMSDVANDLIKEAYIQGIQDHQLTPVSFPQIAFEQNLEEGKDFSFSATIEIQPQPELTNIKGLEVKKEKLDVSEEQISEVLKNLQDSKVEHQNSIKETLDNGDVAVIDFEGFLGEEALPGGKGENHPLEIGSNQFIPGFEEKLVGMKVGTEKTIDLQFPEDYHAKDIAGKTVTFKVKLNKIQQKVAPELNDEFAKSFGDFENLEALKKNIRETLEKRESQRIQDDFRKAILQAIVDNNPFEVPASQVEEQKKLLLEDIQNRFKNQGMGDAEIQEYQQKWANDLDQTAKFMVQSGYVINQISKERDVQVTKEGREKKLQDHAQESSITYEQLASYYNQEESQNRLNYQILEEKILDDLAKEMNVKEVSKEELDKAKA